MSDIHPQKLDAAVLKISGVVILGAIMSILDITIVNVALPTFQTKLDVANYSTVAWTVTAYTLALAAVIPLSGWASDRFGTKRLYMLALLLFTIGSVLCATASSIEMLITYRVLQGLGGGMLMPVGMTIMTRAAGPERMGRLMAVMGIPMLLGPIFGPILGGWLIDVASWHMIFLVNVPVGIIALIYAQLALPNDKPEPTETFDLLGMLLMSPGLALFLYGVSSIPDAGTFFATKVLATMGAGLALMLVFIIYSFKPKHPLLDLRLFKNYDLSISTATMFLFGGAFFGGLLLVPTYFQQVRGEDALMAGWLVAPQGFGAMITMPLAGALADRIPVGKIVPAGLLVIVAAMFGLTQITADTSYTLLIAILFVLGLGMGATMMPLMTSALRTLRGPQIARGSTLVNIIQQVASSIGVAVIAVVFTNAQKDSHLITAAKKLGEAKQTGKTPPAEAMELAMKYGDKFKGMVNDDLAAAFGSGFWVAFILCAITLVVSAFLPRKLTSIPAAHDGDESDAPAPMLMH